MSCQYEAAIALHGTPLWLRFPFFMIEAKSAAPGGNLYQAQNQAAVSGSVALRILEPSLIRLVTGPSRRETQMVSDSYTHVKQGD